MTADGSVCNVRQKATLTARAQVVKAGKGAGAGGGGKDCVIS